MKTNKIGLALGGGGAKGLAHIAFLEVFDELGIEIDVISGTSAGAIIGSLYSSGMKGVEIRNWVDHLIINKHDTLRDILHKREAIKTIEFFDLSFHQSGFLKGKRFLKFLKEVLKVSTFEELQIPLKIVSADFWKSEQVIHESGDILPAIRASMSLPGVFTPVEFDQRILVDGGGVNPVPHDILLDCDTIIAIDVMGFPEKEQPPAPNLLRSTIGMYDVMQNSIIKQRVEAHPPNLYLKPNIQGIDLLDFHKSKTIYKQVGPAVEELKSWLCNLIEFEQS